MCGAGRSDLPAHKGQTGTTESNGRVGGVAGTGVAVRRAARGARRSRTAPRAAWRRHHMLWFAQRYLRQVNTPPARDSRAGQEAVAKRRRRTAVRSHLRGRATSHDALPGRLARFAGPFRSCPNGPPARRMQHPFRRRRPPPSRNPLTAQALRPRANLPAGSRGSFCRNSCPRRQKLPHREAAPDARKLRRFCEL